MFRTDRGESKEFPSRSKFTSSLGMSGTAGMSMNTRLHSEIIPTESEGDFVIVEVDFMSQIKRFFDCLSKQNLTFLEFCLTFTKEKLRICIRHLHSNYWIKITLKLRVKHASHTFLNDDDFEISSYFEINEFQGLFLLLLPDKPVTMIAKRTSVSSMNLTVKQTSHRDNRETLDVELQGVIAGRAPSQIEENITDSFETMLKMASNADHHAYTVHFDSAEDLALAFKQAQLLELRFVTLWLKYMKSKTLLLSMSKEKAIIVIQPETTITFREDKCRFKIKEGPVEASSEQYTLLTQLYIHPDFSTALLEVYGQVSAHDDGHSQGRAYVPANTNAH